MAQPARSLDEAKQSHKVKIENRWCGVRGEFGDSVLAWILHQENDAKICVVEGG